MSKIIRQLSLLLSDTDGFNKEMTVIHRKYFAGETFKYWQVQTHWREFEERIARLSVVLCKLFFLPQIIHDYSYIYNYDHGTSNRGLPTPAREFIKHRYNVHSDKNTHRRSNESR